VPEIEQKTCENIPSVDLTQAELIFDQLKQAEVSKNVEIKKNCQGEALSIAKMVSSRLKEPKKVGSGTFAGEKVSFELGKRGKSSLEQVLADAKKTKNMNSLSKSTIDWEKYKKVNKLEDSLDKNRKDGFIARKNFLLESKEKEKDQLSLLKRKKLN
jgi:hypothetical protein